MCGTSQWSLLNAVLVIVFISRYEIQIILFSRLGQLGEHSVKDIIHKSYVVWQVRQVIC